MLKVHKVLRMLKCLPLLSLSIVLQKLQDVLKHFELDFEQVIPEYNTISLLYNEQLSLLSRALRFPDHQLIVPYTHTVEFVFIIDDTFFIVIPMYGEDVAIVLCLLKVVENRMNLVVFFIIL
jgi:hypothetical protein